MASSTWTWLGLTNSTNTPSNWQLDSGPGNSKDHPSAGDTAILSGISAAPEFLDTQLSGGTTINLTGSGTAQFVNDQGSFNTTSIDPTVTINAMGTATSLLLQGTVTNAGTVEVSGTGDNLTINITAEVTNSFTQTGWFENDGSVIVGAGDTLTIAATGGGTYGGFGTVYVNGGSALINAAMPNFSGDANFSISQSGSLEIGQAGTSAQPNITFNGTGILKIDQPGSFAGTISGFALGDTIDLGVLNVTSVVYDNNGNIDLIGAGGGTVFTAQSDSGALNGNGGQTIALSGTGGIAGNVVVTEGGGGDTVLTVTPPRTFLWAPGVSASAESNNWSVLTGPADPGGGPSPGDTGIIASGTVVGSGDFNLNNNTLEVGGTAGTAALLILATGGNNGGNGKPFASIDQTSTITSDVASAGSFAGNTTPESSLMSVTGPFDNDGTIIADGPAGSGFTIAVVGSTVAGTFVPGYFINYDQIVIDPGNAMTITVGANSEFFNVGEILVNNGSLLFDAAPGAIDGGYAGASGALVIEGDSTVETNATYSSASTSSVPIYAFVNGQTGNTLKIDNIGSFGGAILGFAQNDTIDLGAAITVTSLVYNRTTGILNLDNNGTIVDSLTFASGDFQNGTTTVSGGVAGSFILGTGTDGDTTLTTSVQNDVFDNTSGSWQAGGLWSNGTPGSLDTALIGFGASGTFTLTTGSTPITAGAVIMTDGLLQITSATTFGPYQIRQFGGSIEVTGSNTLTGSQLSIIGGQTEIDPTGTAALSGHVVYGTTGAINGTIAANSINTRAVSAAGGSLLVNGGVLNAGTGQAGGVGGSVFIGVDGGGTPATVTAQANGTNIATVTGLYTEIGSDPTGFGVLTINGQGISGGATWTDQIDPGETATNTTGFMIVGLNNQSSLIGTVIAQPPIAGTATLVVENGATLTEQSYAVIGQSQDASGSVDVAGATWNIGTGPDGCFLTIGDSLGSTGTVTVDSGGTVALGQGGTFTFTNGSSFTGSGINIGLSAASAGTLTVQNTGLVTDGAGLTVGVTGQGLTQILNGGTVQLTGTAGVSLGGSATGVGTLLISGSSQHGTPSMLSLGAAAKGISAGGSGTGTLDVESGGSIQMNGTGGISAGQSANANGVIIVEGQNAVINTGTAFNGMGIAQGASSTGSVLVQNGGEIFLNGTTSTSGIGLGQAAGARGTLDIAGGGTVQMNSPGNINIGQSANATGLVIVNGLGALLSAGSLSSGNPVGVSTGLAVGVTGSGTLEVENGGTVQFDSTAGGLRVGNTGTGLVLVTGTGSSLTLNTPNNAATVGMSGSGTLEVQSGGSVAADTNLSIGGQAAGNGTVSVSGTGSSIILTGTNGAIQVGGPGTGALSISSGGSASALAGVFIASSGTTSHGTVTVTGGTLTDASQLSVGGSGNGTLSVQTGGLVQMTGTNGVNVGLNTGASGTVIIDGGTLSDGSGSFNVSNAGATGTVTVGTGGSLAVGSLIENAGGSISVTGTGAQVSANANVTIGSGGTGVAALTIGSGGDVAYTGNGIVQIGAGSASGTITVNTGGTLSSSGGVNIATVSGSGALLVSGGSVTVAGPLSVGDGTVAVSNGGSILVNRGTSGFTTVSVAGSPGATLSINSGQVSGAAGVSINIGGINQSGSLSIGAGGTLIDTDTTTTAVFLSASGTGTASATVSGPGALWTDNGQINVGGNGAGVLNVSVGGSFAAAGINIGNGGTGTLTVASGGQVTNTGGIAMSVGGFAAGGSGTVVVNGGTLSDTGASFIIGGTNVSGAVTVEAGGALLTGSNTAFSDITASGTGTAAATVNGGTWTSTGQIIVGDTGSGSLDIHSTGIVNASTSQVTIGQQGGGAGIVSLESGGSLNALSIAIDNSLSFGATGTLAVAGGTVTAGSLNESTGGAITVSAGSIGITGNAMIGQGGTGALLSISGGNVSTGALTLGLITGSSGTVTVTGGTLSAGGRVNIGNQGTGAATIDVGGSLIATSGLAIDSNGTSGGGMLRLHGGNATVTGGVSIGSGGNAGMVVDSGGSFIANGTSTVGTQILIGSVIGGGASLIVDDGQVTGTNEGLSVGNGGSGTLLIDDSGTVTTNFASPGPAVIVNATGNQAASAQVIGVGSVWDLTSAGGQFIVGDTGNGSLSVSSQAVTNAGSNVVDIGNQSGGAGTVSVSGGGKFIAAADSNTSSAIIVGAASGATGTLSVSGTGSDVSATGQLTVGGGGGGSLLIADGATVQSGGATVNATQGVDVGLMSTGSGEITVMGTQSLLSNTGEFIVGDAGLGGLTIGAGGSVVTTPGTVAGLAGLVIANTASASGSSVNVSGTGSNLGITGLLDVGLAGSGGLQLSGGGTVSAGSLDAGVSSSAVGQIGLSGTGTSLNITGNATIADSGTGVLSILAGATVNAASLSVGAQSGSSGALVISGNGSDLNLTGALNIGSALGIGDLTLGPGAAVHASVINQQGQEVLEGGLLDPSVNLIRQGSTTGGSGTIAANDVVDEGVIQAGGSTPSQLLLLVQGTVFGGGTLTVNGVVQKSEKAAPLQINDGGTLELQGAVLNAASVTVMDDLTPTGTYTVTHSVVDVSFSDATGVLLLDDIAGFAGTVAVSEPGDQIVITGGTLSGLAVSNSKTLTVQDSGAGAQAGGIDRIIFSSGLDLGGFSIVNGNTIVACFVEGTRIGTEDGSVAVEALVVGHRVSLAAGGSDAVVWVGHRRVDCARHPKPETVWPVCVSAGAFGGNVPVRDLWLSPDHAVFVDGVLVPVKLLVNGGTIRQVVVAEVTYYHVELPEHAVILAEGLTVESYLDVGDRGDFVGQDVVRLFPDFGARLVGDAATMWETRGAAPLVMAGERLEAVRRVVVAHGAANVTGPTIAESSRAAHRARISAAA